jgi:uncharacterized membrane protein
VKVEAYLFLGCAGFFGAADIVYWNYSHDPTGTTALALSAGLGALIAYYSLFLARRFGPRPSDRGDADIAEGAGEMGFFSPHSWWPLIAGLASATMALGFVFGWWLLVIGIVWQLTGVVGILFQYERGDAAEH